uniref:Lon N-terminal domain-containing protein n=1 Tax=Grammatophora oceanica TaxID=210454 RepID=A0A7S1Y1Q5_9STRA|mmetsp:Transcript_10691/g.15572  ORF Transcript_10691/g.15572 Transcript_10691/m.15572 type:complete len:476 (+) Transcript_10691:67-1494(+)
MVSPSITRRRNWWENRLMVLLAALLLLECDSFALLPSLSVDRVRRRRYSQQCQPFSTNTAAWMVRNHALLRRDVEIPLLDLEGSETLEGKVVTPLPSAHLPTELATPFLYGMELTRPVHKMMIQEAIEKGHDLKIGAGEGPVKEREYGHVVAKGPEGGFVGAIGCTAEVLIKRAQSEEGDQERQQTQSATTAIGAEDEPVSVLCRGGYRFVVKEVIRTIPYPVAIVDEIADDVETTVTSNDSSDPDDEYNSLSTSELMKRTLLGLQNLVDQNLKGQEKEISPLEQSIIETSGIAAADPTVQKAQAEEMTAVLQVFRASLLDLATTPTEQYFCVAIMAAELSNLPNEERAQILTMTDGIERLRLVCRHVEEGVGMNRARTIAASLTESKDESEKDLKVGAPQLPRWASEIQKGTRVEYFWNEEWGWCPGVVAEEPMKIMDEYILKVTFDADGETHRLPLSADDKIRWRPEQATPFG